MVTLQGNSNGNRVLCILQRKGDDPIGDNLVKTDCVSNLSDCASLDPNNPNGAFVGKYRLDKLNATQMTGIACTELTHHFVGATGAGGATVIYGCIKDTADKRSSAPPTAAAVGACGTPPRAASARSMSRR